MDKSQHNQYIGRRVNRQLYVTFDDAENGGMSSMTEMIGEEAWRLKTRTTTTVEELSSGPPSASFVKAPSDRTEELIDKHSDNP